MGERRYKEIGRQVSVLSLDNDFLELATTLVEILRIQPSEGGIRNALQHMWGYVSALEDTPQGVFEQWSLKELLSEIQSRALKH
ncbi:MAG: DUF1722 domain-containing protein [Pontibacterium sp.]